MPANYITDAIIIYTKCNDVFSYLGLNAPAVLSHMFSTENFQKPPKLLPPTQFYIGTKMNIRKKLN